MKPSHHLLAALLLFAAVICVRTLAVSVSVSFFSLRSDSALERASSAWAERECAPKPMRTLASRRHTARAAPTNVMILNAMEDEPVLAAGIGT